MPSRESESDAIPPASPPLESSIRCLYCDYDLRGLPGDPVRCPECGNHTGHAEYLAHIARRGPAGTYSVVSAILAPVILLVAAGSIAAGRPFLSCCCVSPLAVTWAFLLVGVWRNAGGTPHWFRAYWRHQFWSMLIILVVVAFIGVGILIAEKVSRPIRGSASPIRTPIAVLLSFVAVGPIGFACSFLITRLLKRAIHWFEVLNRCRGRSKS